MSIARGVGGVLTKEFISSCGRGGIIKVASVEPTNDRIAILAVFRLADLLIMSLLVKCPNCCR